ncbi:hypothetical protein CSQ93_24975 [Janthinobacterium sp. BJB426]|uniref:hypothetical protein n=1 Tax=Janthinobacterium sp. BJB426 TaxID=2048010 RepID=UPI000C0E5A4A|nr:hypothetical protein [Janthinobacterium sp. BJB426]PHV25247.1 hypothetical protein CSQ93_24975 [Janthinobacterium sp. BJB426]
MAKRDTIKKEFIELYETGAKLAQAFQKEEDKRFHYDYQTWYSKSSRAVAALAPDRHEEFRRYYEIDPKRKSLGYGTYVIQDFMKNIVPSGYGFEKFNSRQQVLQCFLNQLAILHSLVAMIDSVLANLENELFADIQDNEVATARQLLKVSPRAAGALVGVVIEAHLQKVADAHSIKIPKKNPTIADLNDPLKVASVLDTAGWRKISFLADIRNLCSHKKDVEPTKEQVEELIEGAAWVTKNIF